MNSESDSSIHRVLVSDRLTLSLLKIGIAVPFLYFGIPILAAPFYPDYSFLRNTASDLGSDRAIYPTPVNIAIVILGILTLLAALGFLLSSYRLRINPLIAWFVSLAVTSNGIATLLSGVYPSPDPRHGGGVLGIGTFLLPFLFAMMLWRQGDRRWLRIYIVANILLFVSLIPIFSGVSGIDTVSLRGLLQRLLAFTAFSPIGVGAFVLLTDLRTYRSPTAENKAHV